MRARHGLLAGVLLLLAFGARAADVPSQDVPGVPAALPLPRYLDARVISYDEADDDEAILPEGPFLDFGFTKRLKLEGRITRVAYVFPRMLSTISIMNHYLDVLKGGGFTLRYQCDGCGGFSFGEALTEPMAEAHSGDQGDRIIDFLHPVGGDVRYVLATLDRPQGRMTLALAVARHVGREPGVFIETVEQPPSSAAPPVEDAAAIEAALRLHGSVVLDGLHFAPGKAAMPRGSRGTLAQVAVMLRADPALRVIVVGHTDNQPPLAQAMSLSLAQAQAVTRALAARWRVPGGQLGALGVGPACPLTANDSDASRALNRRIELVLQSP